jgi:hypothetical protein
MKGSFLRDLSASLTLHSFSVTLFALGSRLFLIQFQINILVYSRAFTLFNSAVINICLSSDAPHMNSCLKKKMVVFVESNIIYWIGLYIQSNTLSSGN